MGACVSVHKHQNSNMKLRLFGSKTDKIVIPSPIKDEPIANGDLPIAEGGHKSHPAATVTDFGGTKENFFDSQPWIESDGEDDFFSVNGDLTPSRGGTPVRQSFSARTPQVKRALVDDKAPAPKPEPSPTNKKKLAELFGESLRGDQDIDDLNTSGCDNGANGKFEAKTTTLGLPPRPAYGTPFVSEPNSVCSSEKTPNGNYRAEKEKLLKSVQCCLPRMLSSHSFSERKKKMSPACSIG